MKSYQELFAELKRRNVFKVAAVYGLTAFVLLQVADLLGQGLRLPDSFMPFITAVIILGFPLALILAWAFELSPQGVRKTTPAGAGEIEAIVAQPASERWPAGLLALVGVALLVAGAWWAGSKMSGRAENGSGVATVRADSLQLAFADASEDDRPSIAVLPFLDMSPQGDQQYFSDGITEEILNTLAKVRDLKVAARTSAFAFRGRDLDMRAIGDSLGVHYLIEGSVRKAGDQLRITAQLIDASDGTHVWSESYDRRMDDVFAIQTEIAEAIAGELRVPLGLENADQLVTPTADLEAYDLYLAARGHMRSRGEDLREAIRLLQAAIGRDSSWAPAWAALAEAHELRNWYPSAWDEQPTDPASADALHARFDSLAERAANRALVLDPDNASARVALGSVFRNRREWSEGEREYRRALVLDPDNAEAHQQYGELLADRGRIAEAVQANRRAVGLDPAPVRRMQMADALFADDRFDEAVQEVRAGIQADPGVNLPALRSSWYLMRLGAGQYELPPELRNGPYGRTAGDGIPTEAQHEQLVRALRAGDPALIPAELVEDWAIMALTWSAFDSREQGLMAIEQSASPANRAGGSLYWLWLPVFDPLRQDPRFQAVLATFNLADARLQRTPR